MTDEIIEEIGRFERELERLGFHPQTVRAYRRKLREFLEERPETLGLGEDESADAIRRQIESGRGKYDGFSCSAALRRWHIMRFGTDLGRPRVRPGDFAPSAGVKAEAGRLRVRLESDGLSESAIDATCSTVTTFLAWRFPDGDVDPSEVRGSDVTGYLTEAKPHLKPAAARTEAGRIRRYLLLLSEEDPSRPDEPSYAPSCWGSSSLPRMVTDGELDAILSAQTGDEVGSRNRAAILLMANMGLRCCEVAALTLDDIDFRNGEVLVRASKSQSSRRLPLEAEAGAALADYLAVHRPRGASRSVFLRSKSHRGEPMSQSQIRGSLRYQARLAGVADFGTHMLRRRAATSMVASGNPMKVVADVLGHAGVQTTSGYLRMDVEGLRKVASEWPGGRRG